MGVLGKKQRQIQADSPSGIEGLLVGFLGKNAGDKDQNFLESILDADGDGSVIDDVAGIILGKKNSKKDLGGILGRLFGEK
tara:strand:- start:1506 stop:1748 length:243 start_codon:yes stop_codon:yes gene_type:complete